MTDRELLELAAKAADYRYWQIEDIWNPLTDDGDALRLAVKLKIDLYINHAVRVDYSIEKMPSVPLYEPIEPDSYAATRRAIVRAAAEIGKEKK